MAASGFVTTTAQVFSRPFHVVLQGRTMLGLHLGTLKCANNTGYALIVRYSVLLRLATLRSWQGSFLTSVIGISTAALAVGALLLRLTKKSTPVYEVCEQH